MQKIITPGGETLVVLPLAEYEKLIDDADIAMADEVHRNITAGLDELVPEEVVGRLFAGESPIRVWRQFRKITAQDLSRAAGISGAYLSELETGRKEGRLSVLKRIALALSVDLDDLIWERGGDAA